MTVKWYRDSRRASDGVPDGAVTQVVRKTPSIPADGVDGVGLESLVLLVIHPVGGFDGVRRGQKTCLRAHPVVGFHAYRAWNRRGAGRGCGRSLPTAARRGSVSAMRLRRLLLVCVMSGATSLGNAVAASGATKTEVRSKTSSRETVFRGVGCTSPSTRTLSLPRGAFGVVVTNPVTDDVLVSAESEDSTAVIQSTAINGRSVEWVAVGYDAACDIGAEATEWETEVVALRIRYNVKVRVLTHATVVNRADRLCRKYKRRFEVLSDRFDRLSSNDLDGAVRSLRDMSKLFRGWHRALGKLAVPTERQSSFVRYRGAMDRVQERMDTAADRARDYDVGGLEFQIRKLGYALDDMARFGRRYGLRGCVGS